MTGPRKNIIADEERGEMHNAYHNRYGKKSWKCDICNIELNYFSRTKHLHSMKHLKNVVERWKCDI